MADVSLAGKRASISDFYVNGIHVVVPENKNLLRFLRDDMRLTSVKNGCGEGACGACTVLIDGKPTRACIPMTDRMQGRQIITCEGLTPRERAVYAYAFTKCGAVQCGFCTPGMVMSAKALLDKNICPTAADARDAIKNNICRCTGYQKIVDAILLAAELFREGTDVPDTECAGLIGDNLPRVDAPAKALCTSTGCCTASRCAAHTRARRCFRSTQARPKRCPAW